MAAARLGVTPTTVRRWLSEGRLAGVRVGGRYRVDQEALDAIVQPAEAAERDRHKLVLARRRGRR